MCVRTGPSSALPAAGTQILLPAQPGVAGAGRAGSRVPGCTLNRGGQSKTDRLRKD